MIIFKRLPTILVAGEIFRRAEGLSFLQEVGSRIKELKL